MIGYLQHLIISHEALHKPLKRGVAGKYYMIFKGFFYISITIIGIAILSLGFKVILSNYYQFYVVDSGSMVPTLNINDFVIVSKFTPFSELKVGDIIVFRSLGSLIPNELHETIVHRIVQVSSGSNGDEIIRTKGDANPRSIPFIDYPIEEHNYVGKVAYVVPKLGVISKLVNPPAYYFIIAGIVSLVVLCFI